MSIETQFAESLQRIKSLPAARDHLAAYRQEAEHLAACVRALPLPEQASLRHDWLSRLTAPLREPDPHARAALGRILGLLDWDTRPGLGLNADGLPAVDWVEIPAGTFLYQDGEQRPLPTFYISRYHITSRQFGAFLQAEDGFHDARWWEGFPETRQRAKLSGVPPVQAFDYPNHPFDGANWYDALAFCRWWSYRLGGKFEAQEVWEWKVRLCTDLEWEKAARGAEGRRYPWGDDYISGYANLDERDRFGIQGAPREEGHFFGGTTAAGIFPQAASPYGVMDMVGTIWDMLLSLHHAQDDPDLSSIYPRLIRGGTWFTGIDYASVTTRTMHEAHVRFYDYGFRVCTREPF